MKLLPAFLLAVGLGAARPVTEYRCLPCGGDCDKMVLAAPGKCPHCAMELVDAATIRHHAVPAANVCDWIGQHPGALVIDVRTPEEFAGTADPDFGSLKGAINIPVTQLAARVDELAAYKDKPVLVYCSHSHRSPQAAYRLTEAGFRNVTNMSGGISVLPTASCKR